MHTTSSILLALIASTALAGTASAQGSDLIVMRKVMPELEPPSFPGKWTAGDWTWSANVQTCTDAATRTRTYFCMQNGAVVPEARCKGPAPKAEQQSTARYEGCTYSWTRTGEGTWDKTCSDTAKRAVSYECRRNGGDSAPTMVDSARCGPAPAATENGSNYAGCTYEWRPTGYSGWLSSCSDSTTRNVTYACRRTGGDALPIDVDSAKCGKYPSGTETAANYAGCSYAWARKSNGAWSGDKCVASSTRTIEWGCQRSGGQSATAFVPTDQEFMCGKNTNPLTEKGGSCALVNGDFEGASIVNGDGKVGAWNTRGNGYGYTDSDGGNRNGYIRIGANAGGYYRQFLEQIAYITAGTKYKLTFRYKTSGYGGFPAMMNFRSESLQLPTTSTWKSVSFPYSSTATGNAYLTFSVWNENSKDSAFAMWVDDVVLEEVK